jgi:hypothetical protein
MSSKASSIDSDYVIVKKPDQDEVEEGDAFVIVEKQAGTQKVNQGPHEFKVRPLTWLR